MKKQNLDFKIIKQNIDEFGISHGVFLVNKPANKTSHDIVNWVRSAFQYHKVGHAGALDPFATGALLILVGNETKNSNFYTDLDKEYIGEFVVGIGTDTHDTEGNIIFECGDKFYSIEEVKKFFESIQPSYEQYVPVFSSKKINGINLRKIIRRAKEFILDELEGEINIKLVFQDGKTKIVPLPKKTVQIKEVEILDNFSVDGNYLKEKFKNLKHPKFKTYQIVKVRLLVSKGTYIRSIARDLGNFLNPKTGVSLLSLHRTKIGDWSIE